MITRKLMHDIQTWLNSFYDFDNIYNDKNNHIISSIRNFAFRFIEVNIRIWSLCDDGSLHKVEANYNQCIKSKEDFIKFKNKVDSTINDYIKTAIYVTKRNEEYGN